MAATMGDGSHEPVLAAQVVELLVTDRAGTYLDLTAGGGGHLKVLARALDDRAALYGADVDPEAVERCREALADLPQFRQILQTDFGSIAHAVAGITPQGGADF